MFDAREPGGAERAMFDTVTREAESMDDPDLPFTIPAVRLLVLICANAEWRVIRRLMPDVVIERTPVGEWFVREMLVGDHAEEVCFLHTGWGKIAAASATQHAIDRWHPELIVNLGTCGGFHGAIERECVVIVERTIVYDIIEQMENPDEAIAHYTTEIDLSWTRDRLPHGVLRAPLLSADRDLVATDVASLAERYGAVAGDWESGAIAWVAARNATPVVILRGVSDLVGAHGGDAYDGGVEHFYDGADRVMRRLLELLPSMVSAWRSADRS